MRIFEVGAVGAALAYLSFSFAHTGTGHAQAAAFVLAILIATVTSGLVISLATHAWPEEPGLAIAGPRWLHRCHVCGHRMRLEGAVRVCARCDRVPARLT